MNNSMAAISTVITLFSVFCIIVAFLTNAAAATASDAQHPEDVEAWFENLTHSPAPAQKMTKLHFYFHDSFAGKNATAASITNINMTAMFGNFVAADDPMTMGPGFHTKRMGYVRGLYGGDNLDEIGLLVAMTFVFMDGAGALNGSTLSILGDDPIGVEYREMPIVGGTGAFRLARGIATFNTYSANAIKANFIIEVHASVLHY